MTTVGMHGAGHMGAGLGWALREGGARVVTTLAGRSARTRKLVADAGLEPLDSLDAVVAAADVILTVVPPDAARNAAAALAEAARRTGRQTSRPCPGGTSNRSWCPAPPGRPAP